MNIAFCIFKYFPFGGIQRDLMKMVAECRRRGHGVRIYAIHWRDDGPLPDGVAVKLAPVRALTNHRLYERFANWVRDDLKAEPVDLVVGMNKMPGLDAYYAGDSCYQHKARTQRSAWYRLLPRYRALLRLERAVYDTGAGTEVLTISDAQTPIFRRYYQTPAERFHALPPGIERNRTAPADRGAIRGRMRASLGVGEAECLLLFIGSGFIKKGLDRLLKGFKALPRELVARTWLYVLGDDNADPFQRLAARLGIGERVRFMGGRADVPDFLFAADGFVLPAYDENAGMAILEAMISGTPALVTENCGYARYLRQAGAGLVTPAPYDQDTFNGQLAELITSDQRADWSRSGRALADDERIYQLAQCAVDLFERFAGRPRTIAFCLFKYFPFGGLQRDFLKVALECQARGHRVRAYVLGWQGDVPEGFDVVRVPVKRWTNHGVYGAYARWVAADLASRRVAAVVGFNKIPGLDFYYAADPCYAEKARSHWAGLLYRRTSRCRRLLALERAVFATDAKTVTLAITEDQVQTFRTHYGTSERRFRLMPPGLGEDRRRPAGAAAIRSDFRCQFGLGDDQLVLLFVGSGFVTKGLDRALRALAALPPALCETCLFVIGEDNPRPFLRLARKLGVAGRVRLLPGQDDVVRFLLGADLLLHPAYSESGGIVLLEAAIAGLPVIATGTCGFAHHIERAGAGRIIAEPFNQGHLNETVAAALRNPQQRAQWAANGIRYGQHQALFDMPKRAVDCIEAKIEGKDG